MNSRKLRAALLALSLAAAAGGAGAQTSPGMNECVIFPESCPSTGTNEPGLSSTQQRGTVLVPLLVISDVVGANLRGGLGPRGGSARLGSPETGVAGAVQGPRWGAWVALAKSRVDYAWAPLSSGGDIDSVIAGVDYRVSEKLTAGVSLALDRTGIHTRFNNGRLSGDGANVAPYLGWQIDESWSLDASAGLGRAQSDVTDNVARTRGSTDADRLFGALNLNYSRWLGKWELAGKGTVLYTREEKDAYTLSNGTAVAAAANRLGQLRLGGQLGYLAESGLNPYIALAYVTDYKRDAQAPIAGAPPPANDRDGWAWALGMNVFSRGAVSGGVRFQKEDRREQKLSVLLANISFRF